MRCDPRVEGPYEEFKRRAIAAALRDRIPISGTIETTASCNLACSQCYIPRELPGHRDPTTEQWFGILEQLAEAGCLWLGITGGEPLLRRDFWPIYQRARGLGFLITLMTNGTLIDEEVADLLAAAPPLMIEITVYGASAATYASVTGDPRAHEAVTAAVDRLVDRGIRLTLKTTLTRKNVGDLAAIERMALERGLPFRFDGLLNSRLDGDRAPLAERIDPMLLARLEMGDPERLERWEAARDHQERTRGWTDAVFACGAGRSTFHVSYEGALSPCIMARQPAFPLTTGRFREGWDGPVLEAVSRTASQGAPCTGCDLLPVCSTCAGWGLCEHGDPEAAERYLCEVASFRNDSMVKIGVELCNEPERKLTGETHG